MPYQIIFMTASNKQEAMNIVRTLLQEHLIACANVIDEVSSFFWWNKNIEEQKEVLVIMKSHSEFFKNLSKKVKDIHSYKIPEILAIPITEVSQSYLEWMNHSLNR